MKKLTDEQIVKAVASAKASLEMEGQSLSQEQEDRIKRVMRGDITHAEFVHEAAESAKRGQ